MKMQITSLTVDGAYRTAEIYWGFSGYICKQSGSVHIINTILLCIIHWNFDEPIIMELNSQPSIDECALPWNWACIRLCVITNHLLTTVCFFRFLLSSTYKNHGYPFNNKIPFKHLGSVNFLFFISLTFTRTISSGMFIMALVNQLSRLLAKFRMACVKAPGERIKN